MTDERLILAIGRIERAISRLEGARPAAAEQIDLRSGAIDRALAERHAALRARTAEAIVRIDALLHEPPAEGAAGTAPPPDELPPPPPPAGDPA